MQVAIPLLTTDMSPSRLADVLATLGWSAAELARRLNVSERTVRRWGRGDQPIPPQIDQWLEQMATYMQGAPPPP
jgi:DNA-binding transcriptional regulator YiaG